jgi:hypothetical protein
MLNHCLGCRNMPAKLNDQAYYKTVYDTFSSCCKVCRNMVVFDLSKPNPKVWLCPVCGHKNYSHPKPKGNAYGSDF